MLMSLVGAGKYPMGTREASEAFIHAINTHDVDAISRCMSEDHVFIDSLGNRVTGQKAMSSGWRAYFSMFPDYHITCQTLMIGADEALLCGQATGSFFEPALQPTAARSFCKPPGVPSWQMTRLLYGKSTQTTNRSMSCWPVKPNPKQMTRHLTDRLS